MDCTFCQIVAGEKPCYRVYEDQYFLAFLDNRPFVEGHTLLIPKKHYRWVWKIQEPGLFEAAVKISQSMIKNLRSEYVSYLSMGNQSEHTHLHLIPRKSGDSLFLFEGLKRLPIPASAMAAFASKIYSNIC